MSFVGVQATVNFYTEREADLTNQLTDIMTNITQATKQISNITEDEANQKGDVRDKYDPDTDEYDEAMEKINDEHAIKLAEISEWESELETQKQAIETELKATTSYKESFMAVLKQNVQKDFKYGGN